MAASGGIPPYQYSLDGINYQTSPIFAGLAPLSYTIWLKDAANVIITANTSIPAIPKPILSFTTTPASCLNNDGSISLTATGGTAPYQYSIDGSALQSSGAFSGLPTGNHIVIVKDATGCEVSSNINLVITNTLITQTGISATICQGEKVLLNTISNGTSFTWSPSTGLNNDQQKEPEASPSVTTKYYVTAKLGACTRLDSFLVNVKPAPVANAGNDVSVCLGQDVRLNGSGGISYSWSPAIYLDDPTQQSPDVIHPQSTTTYKLIVTGANGCKSISADEVLVNIVPPPLLFAGNDTSVAINQPFQLLARDINNTGFSSYIWSPSTGLNNIHIKDPVATLDRDVTFIVTATTASGCKSKGTVSIKVYRGPEMYVAAAFTPNNDGKNDVLHVKPIGIKKLKSFTVYNRYGMMIFSTNDALKGWDGKYRQMPQESGTYTWVANGIDIFEKQIVKKGTVVLIR